VGLIHKGKLLVVGTPGEVKKLMRGTILEIRIMESRKAVTLLREQLDPESVGLFGDRIHIVTQEPERTAMQASAILARADLELGSIRPIEPSLEDVFVSVLATYER
jgi:ABC-2 type transport system ATP-binding protein